MAIDMTWCLWAYTVAVIGTCILGPDQLFEPVNRRTLVWVAGVLVLGVVAPAVITVARTTFDPERLWVPRLLLNIELAVVAILVGQVTCWIFARLRRAFCRT